MAISFQPQQSSRINFGPSMQAAQEMFRRQNAVYGQMLAEVGPRGLAAIASETNDPGIAQYMRRLGLGDFRNYITTDNQGNLTMDGMNQAQQARTSQYLTQLTQRQQVQQPPVTQQIVTPPGGPNNRRQKSPAPNNQPPQPVTMQTPPLVPPAVVEPQQPAVYTPPSPPPPVTTAPPTTAPSTIDEARAAQGYDTRREAQTPTGLAEMDEVSRYLGYDSYGDAPPEAQEPIQQEVEARQQFATGETRSQATARERGEQLPSAYPEIELNADDSAVGSQVWKQVELRPTDPQGKLAIRAAISRAIGSDELLTAEEIARRFTEATGIDLRTRATHYDEQGISGINLIRGSELQQMRATPTEPADTTPQSPGEYRGRVNQITPIPELTTAEAVRTDARSVPGEGPGGTTPQSAQVSRALNTAQEAGTSVATVTPPTADNSSGELVVATPDGELNSVPIPRNNTSRKVARALADASDPSLPEGRRRAASAEVQRQAREVGIGEVVTRVMKAEPVVTQVTEWTAGPGREAFTSVLNQAEQLYRTNPAQAASVFGGIFASRLEADRIVAETESEVARARQLNALANQATEQAKQLQRQNEVMDRFYELYGVDQLVQDQAVQAEVDRLRNELIRDYGRDLAEAERDTAVAGAAQARAEAEMYRPTREATNAYTRAQTSLLEAQVKQLGMQTTAMEALQESGELSFDQIMDQQQLALDQQEATAKLMFDLLGIVEPDSEIGATITQTLLQAFGGMDTDVIRNRILGIIPRGSYRVEPSQTPTVDTQAASQTTRQIMQDIGDTEVE